MKRNVRKNDGTIARMEYSDICQAIGVSADVNFIKITNAGTISFYLAKTQEIKWLLSATKSAGFVPAKRLLKLASI